MPAPGGNAQIAPAAAASPGAAGGVIPFQVGSYHYAEQIAADVFQLSAATVATEFVHLITPGGFLRGVDLLLTTQTAGTTGVIANDFPFGGVPNISIENIDGSPILYPMPAYSYATWQRYCAPWLDDPFAGPNFSVAPNTPGFLLHLWPEIFGTAGVMSNTDARSQYRIRYTLGAATQFATAYTLFPLINVTEYLQTWAQPDRDDLHGQPVELLPPGLAVARQVRRQIVPLNPGGATTIAQLTLTGNEIRCVILIVRDATGVRQDWIAGPIRLRLDDRSMGVYTVAQFNNLVQRFYPGFQIGTLTRQTGVYVFPRFRSSEANNDPMPNGQYWLATSNATYLTFEFPSANASTAGSTIEIISDEVIVLSDIDSILEGI